MFHVVLVAPEIPPNTGNIGRLCLATGAQLHLVEPLGFSLDEKSLRRAGLDYWDQLDVKKWPSLDAFLAEIAPSRMHFVTTKAGRTVWEAAFEPGDYLVFGRETKGLPESLLARYADQCVAIPMPGAGSRSLNLATAAGIALYEALRQNQSAAGSEAD